MSIGGGSSILTCLSTGSSPGPASRKTSRRWRQLGGEFGQADPLVAVMVAARWFFYFYTVEKCFGVPMHFGMSPLQATDEFINLLRFGLLSRAGGQVEVQGARRGVA